MHLLRNMSLVVDVDLMVDLRTRSDPCFSDSKATIKAKETQDSNTVKLYLQSIYNLPFSQLSVAVEFVLE
ncbi:hypothetical protein JHK86_050059 [Glycine max]|nr:hypothetical protein JHK86_050059 [Glycine max]